MSGNGDFKLVSVGALSRQDQLALLAIRNQRSIRDSSFQSHVIGEAEHFSWIADVCASASSCFFAFCQGGQIFGGIGLKNINIQKDRGEWSFYLSEGAHGKGLGLKMAVMALDRFFADYPITSIVGETLEGNRISQQFHQKLGFEESAKDSLGGDASDCGPTVKIFELSRDVWRRRRSQLGA